MLTKRRTGTRCVVILILFKKKKCFQGQMFKTVQAELGTRHCSASRQRQHNGASATKKMRKMLMSRRLSGVATTNRDIMQ